MTSTDGYANSRTDRVGITKAHQLAADWLAKEDDHDR